VSDYTPPASNKVKIILGESDYNPQSYNRVSINLTPDQEAGEAQYIGGDGWSSSFLGFGQPVIRLQTRYVNNLTVGNTSAFGHPKILNQRDLLKPSGGLYSQYGYPRVFNLNQRIAPGVISFFAAGRPTVQTLRNYIRTGAFDFLRFGAIRISYKEQHVTTRQANPLTLWGNTRIAYAVRYIEQHSPQEMSRFGTSWASFSPRYVEPRGIFNRFPSNHTVATSRTVNMIGTDFLKFGTRIIPESQVIYPQGFSTVFGDTQIYNHLQHIRPKGFLTVGEHLDLRFGHPTTYNLTQYVKVFHDDTSRAAGPLFPDIREHDIANRNRTIKTHGSLHQVFGYQVLNNTARVLNPEGIASPIELGPSKSMISHGIRRIQPDSIEAPYMSSWHIAWLSGTAVKQKGITLSLFGTTHVENTRRYYRFISFGELSLFGKPTISHAVRHLRIQSDYSIAPPVIPMPEVKLGVRYIEPESIDSVHYGWSFLTEKFTKIAPRWVQVDRVGEPSIKNITPEVKLWQFDSSEFGMAYIGLYHRYVLPNSLNAQVFGRPRVSDRTQQINLRSYGIAPPTITKLHQVEEIGAGQYLPRRISPYGFYTENFSKKPEEQHVITQNVVRLKSGAPMTLFGKPVVTANSIRVEPGLWENLIGMAKVEYKNRRIYVDSSENDYLKIGRPVMSPQTIWTTDQPPQQAIRNHPDQRLPLHHIGGYSEELGMLVVPGITFGRPNIHHRHRFILATGTNFFAVDKPSMRNEYFIIAPKGMSTLRFGVIAPIGDQTISFRINAAHSQYGSAKIENIKPYNNILKPSGIALMNIGKPVIDHYHRNIAVPGLDSLSMGRSKSGDSPYMWQGLRIGPNVPTRVGGDIHSRYGTAWISPRVREVLFKGQDYSLVGEYEPGNFNLKLQIWNRTQPEPPTYQLVRGIGFMSQQMGTPNIKLAVHYIRPYGNTDNHRKGGLDTNARS